MNRGNVVTVFQAAGSCQAGDRIELVRSYLRSGDRWWEAIREGAGGHRLRVDVPEWALKGGR